MYCILYILIINFLHKCQYKRKGKSATATKFFKLTWDLKLCGILIISCCTWRSKLCFLIKKQNMAYTNLFFKFNFLQTKHNCHCWSEFYSSMSSALLTIWSGHETYSGIWCYDHPVILPNVLQIFVRVLVGSIGLYIKAFNFWWSLPVFSLPVCLIRHWYCNEKLVASHYWVGN